jgi:hypothetical protein
MPNEKLDRRSSPQPGTTRAWYRFAAMVTSLKGVNGIGVNFPETRVSPRASVQLL